MKKILFINQYYCPDQSASSLYLTDVCCELSNRNFDVSVLCSRMSYRNKKLTYPSSEDCSGVHVYRTGSRLIEDGSNSRMRRLLNELMLHMCFAFRALRLGRYDTVVVMTSPPLIGWIGSVLKCIFKCRLIYWVLDLNPDQAVRLGWIKNNGFFHKTCRAVANNIVNCADEVVVLDRYMQELMKTEYSLKDRQKIKVKKLWTLPRQQIFEADVRKELKLFLSSVEGKKLFLLGGNLSVCHPIETFLLAILELKECLNFVFVFAGGGPRSEEVIQFKERYGLHNLFYFDHLNQNEFNFLFERTDIHLMALGNDFSGIVHPSKYYQIRASGKPFIFLGPECSYVGDELTDSGLGINVRHDDVESMISAMTDERFLNSAAFQAGANPEDLIKHRDEALNSLIRVIDD